MFNKLMTYLTGLAAIVLMSACGPHIPSAIKQPLDGGPSIAQVRHQTDDYLSQKVRWGGVILHIDNKKYTTELTIIALPLSDRGKPRNVDKSLGRFIAVTDEFMEPLVYSPERKITITGRILRSEAFKVGEFPYEHPIIQIENYYLWPVEVERSPFDYHPFLWMYGPYYPWWHHRWHHPHFHPHHHHFFLHHHRY